VTTEVGVIRTWRDVLIDTENLRGSGYGDSFTGDQQRNRMVGSFGDDDIDAVDGISGNDVVNGAFDVDACRADAGDRVKACEA
jgi:hypothetical protein